MTGTSVKTMMSKVRHHKRHRAKRLPGKEGIEEISLWLDGLEERAIAFYGRRRWQQMVGRKEPADRLMFLLISAAAAKDKKDKAPGSAVPTRRK